ncbi:sister chromatid cohesion protein PDS5 homolog A [Abrus precatorius]|uniref:Sister chromatid cohesion protein PDS5 homolog A n=1 Tax=Abrus precatorius TaxID=3816 RepID=A0A8B8MIF0_ABRPR|nr:sister chromatid cohesion protein PDS5 homolog A [Abrus precatorius]
MDKSSLQLLSKIGTHLAQRTRPNKDFIVKSLTQAANALSQLEQCPQVGTKGAAQGTNKRKAALKPLANAVVCGGLLQHADKEVRLLVAICVTELLRLEAPECPFEEKHLRDVFKLIISLFADLADTGDILFSKRVKVLDTVAQLRCCVIMLDIGGVDLVLEMFNIFFSVVRDDHHDILVSAMTSIMITSLNESEKDFQHQQRLLEVILRNLIKRKKEATVAAYELAVSVIKTCAQEDKLTRLISKLLTACIHDGEAASCVLKEFYHEIIFNVFQCAPQMLLAVIPSLIIELLADQVDVRIKAVNLVGKLFALPEHHVAQKYHELFVEFLKRFSDRSVDVRISALQCAKALCLANPHGRESHEIITSVEGRLLDVNDRVRMLAVLVACDISISNLKLVPSKLISQATGRLRDKKISVRKRALQKLIEVYQDYCNKCYNGSMIISDQFEEIPCKIMMLCYDTDCVEFRLQKMEFVLADDLFPKHLSVEERTKHWIHMFSLFSSPHEKALNSILTQKRRLQNEMKNYLAMRKNLKEICSEEIHKKIESMFTTIATSFPDSQKAEECLHKLNQTKDNNVFKLLEKFLEEQTFNTGQTIKDELVVIGDNNPYYEFLHSLLSKCSSNIFSSDHVECLLDYLSNNESGNKDLKDSSVNLLLAIVQNFPSMLKSLEKKFQMLLEQTSPVNDKLIEVIAKAGSHTSFNLSEIYPFLERMCLDGTPRQAKFAVSAIAALSSEQSVFLDLFKGLIDSLYSQWNVPTVLQSLGCIAQYSVSTFETRHEEITSYISQKIIQMEHMEDSHDATSFQDTSQCSESCQLKIYGLKTLVKSFLPYQGSPVKHNISGLLDILSRMLLESDGFVSTATGSCENDKAQIRLAAAKAILRLAWKWDLHITPQIFHITILIAKDSSSFVRSRFLSKTQKLLKERKLPIRFACAFALAATNAFDDLQYQNYKYLAEFIKDYSIVAHTRQTSAVQGAIIDYPAYILVFLIHVLARNNDFAFEICQDEKKYADICSPLFFILRALIDDSIVGDLNLVNDAVSHLFSIFRAIRKVEDAVDVQMTTKLHMLAEIGIFTLNALKGDGISVCQVPGQVLLPSSLYRANSKSPKSFFDENFLSRVFHTLQKSMPQGYTQKTAETLLKHGHKGHQDVPKYIYGVLDLASSKPDNLPRREIENAKTVRPNIPSVKRRKCVSQSGSGSIGLHECSTIEKQQKLPSKHCQKSIESNLFSSSDSVISKGSLSESHVPTCKTKRTAACSLENAVTSSKHTVQPSKCPRTKLKDTCGSKRQDILADVSNKNQFSLCVYVMGPLLHYVAATEKHVASSPICSLSDKHLSSLSFSSIFWPASATCFAQFTLILPVIFSVCSASNSNFAHCELDALMTILFEPWCLSLPIGKPLAANGYFRIIENPDSNINKQKAWMESLVEMMDMAQLIDEKNQITLRKGTYAGDYSGRLKSGGTTVGNGVTRVESTASNGT